MAKSRTGNACLHTSQALGAQARDLVQQTSHEPTTRSRCARLRVLRARQAAGAVKATPAVCLRAGGNQRFLEIGRFVSYAENIVGAIL
jgi:hypothetical protein